MSIIASFFNKFFYKFHKINWYRISTVLGSLVVAWGFLATLMPPKWHTISLAVLSFLSTFIASVLKGGHSGTAEPPITEPLKPAQTSPCAPIAAKTANSDKTYVNNETIIPDESINVL